MTEGGGGACVNIHELVNMLSRKEISGRVRNSVCHKSLKKSRAMHHKAITIIKKTQAELIFHSSNEQSL